MSRFSSFFNRLSLLKRGCANKEERVLNLCSTLLTMRMLEKRNTVTDTRIDSEVLDELLKDVTTRDDLQGVLRQLGKRFIERALQAEITEHLGHDKGRVMINPEKNVRSGSSKKRLQGELGKLELELPQDRQESAGLCGHGHQPAGDQGGAGVMTLNILRERSSGSGPWQLWVVTGSESSLSLILVRPEPGANCCPSSVMCRVSPGSGVA